VPYERPPLSKAMLQSDGVCASRVLTDTELSDPRIQFLAPARVTLIRPEARQLELDDQRIVHYEQCLLATGGRVRTLHEFPEGSPHVHYLRTIDDARRLRSDIRPGQSLAVIGAGFLGLEAALSARKCGMDVSLIESASSLLGRFVPEDLSIWLADMLRDKGVALHLGQQLASTQVWDEGFQLTLQNGQLVQSDAVLVAIGLIPEVALARAARLTLSVEDGGVDVGADGRTSAAHVFAAGDCASQYRPALGRALRLESWQNANEQARAVAAGLMGLQPPEQAFPWFWTDPGEHNIQMLGLKAPGLHYVRRGDPNSGRGALWLGLRDGIAVHGVALNAGGELRALRPFFERGLRVDPNDFSAIGPDLRAWAKSRLAESRSVIT
jgi:NADPH-dependent 2,4-dienoyl-CoA reductase/sulfur reductase-like enzyme